MSKFDKCPGCGHNYNGIPGLCSTPNEQGYCHWCREEGVFDKTSQEHNDAKWEAFHKARRAEEAEELERMKDGW